MDDNLPSGAAERIAKLEAQIAAIKSEPASVPSVEQAKKALAYDEKAGWAEPTEEDEAYARSIGSKSSVTLDGKKIIARLRTPRIIALEYVARGEIPPPPSRPSFDTSYKAPADGTPAERRAGPKGRQIQILEISNTYEGVLKKDEDYSFESAAEAARLLEVTPAFLSQEFKKAAGKPITVRGVTIQYLDLYVADDANFHD